MTPNLRIVQASLRKQTNAVEYVREIMKNGTGADRQLQVFQKTGDMKAVVDYIIEETEVGVEEDQDEADDLPTAKAV